MIQGTGYKKQDLSSSLYWIKRNIWLMVILLVISSALVLPGCSSSKIMADENAASAENNADTDDQAKQNEGETSNSQPNSKSDLTVSEYITASHMNLKLYIPDTDVLKELGEAEEKSEAIIWGSDGLEHQTWKYPSQGIELDMVKDSSKQGGQAVKSISISTPSSFRTSRGIGIGSTSNEVLAAYEAEIEEENISESEMIAGSIYGGVIFRLENDRVSSIFIGAAAE